MTKASERNVSPSYFVKFDSFMYRVTFLAVMSWQMISWKKMKDVWILWGMLLTQSTPDIVITFLFHPGSRLRSLLWWWFGARNCSVIFLARIAGARYVRIPSEYGELQHLFPCKGDLYSTARPKSVIVSYNPHTNSWTRLSNIGEDTYLLKIYVGNDESYALLSDVCTSCIDSHIRSLENDLCDRAHSTFIS